MPIFSRTAGIAEPVVVDGDTYIKSEWMANVSGEDSDAEFSPTVFLVDQPPNVSLRTHFHRQNQFQLFVRGSGSIGRHKLGPLMVHYANAYTGYGPLVAGPDGLAYFTLRTVFEKGSLTMTQHAAEMKRGPKRQLHSEIVPVADTAALTALQSPEVNDLIPPEPDGVAARLYALPPHSTQTGLDPAESAGQFYVVLAGSLVAGERTLQTWESVFVAPDELPFVLLAGSEGVQVICVQLPPRAAEYR